MTFDLIKAQNALTEKQRNFVELWLVHRNAHYAYVEAYEAKRMSPATAYRDGHRMLRHPKIAPIIEARLTALGEALTDETEMSVARVLDAFVELAKADPDEVTGVRVGACRYCHGVDHMYQWTPAEFAEATRKAEKAETELPDPSGGLDFDRTALPDPACPECRGEGQLRQVPVDTSKLSPGGRALFAGVKPTANGLEIKLRDRDKALENAAKIIGAFRETIDLRVKADVKVAEVTPENAADVYKEMLK
jgi:phage terminase small subunit